MELRDRGADVVRFNTEDLPSQAGLTLRLSSTGADGYLEVAGRTVELPEISSVWYRRPAEPIPPKEITDLTDKRFAVEESEEALFGLWRVLDCTWVSHPDALNAASYKPAQLRVGAALGFDVPRTIITNDPGEALRFVREADGDVVLKPLRFGLVSETGGQQEIIFTNILRKEDVAAGLGQVKLCPCLLQEYVHKDVELRVTVVGSEVFASEILSQEAPQGLHDWRRADVRDLPHRAHDLPAEVADRCVALVDLLGLNFGAIDLILTPTGRYVFLEINPNGQWLWVEHLAGLPITDALVRLLMRGLVSSG